MHCIMIPASSPKLSMQIRLRWTPRTTTCPRSTLSSHNIVDNILTRIIPIASLHLALALAPSVAITVAAQAEQSNASPYLMTSIETIESLPPFPTKYPPLPSLKKPDLYTKTLKNGLRVIFLPDHETPTINGVLLMKGGQRASPPEKLGIATISAAAQRAGGSMQHPEMVFDDALEDIAASVEAGASPEAISIGFSCLEKDVQKVMDLLSEIVESPLLPENKINLFKAQAANGLIHRNDVPSMISRREVSKILYGADSVFTREATLETVSSITQEDIANFLRTWERPDSAVLGIVGDFSEKGMLKIVEDNFSEWKPLNAQGEPPVLPTSTLPSKDTTKTKGKVYFIDRPGSTQASVSLAELGIQFGDKDEVALDVLSDILNGFGGSLFDTIRSREGLAYSISGGWSAPLDHPGVFLASAETSQPAQLLLTLRHVLDNVVRTKPTDGHVQEAIEESLNSFVFGFASSEGQLRRAVAFELLGIPQNYPFEYKEKLSHVTAEDVQGAAQRHLHPYELVTVVVGDAKSLVPQIESVLGVKVQMISVD